MKVVLLGAASCIHTTRWANGLADRGIKVHLVSAHLQEHDLDPQVQLYVLKNKAPAGYITAAGELRRILRDLKPDLLNTHFATGYGLLSRLAAYHPTLLSVWGSDVYDFPEKSALHRWLLKGNLKAVSAIASTSYCMARKTAETHQHPKVHITPFGIDPERFCPTSEERDSNKVIIGTVKTIKPKYGIDTLIHAFTLAVEAYKGPKELLLEITGGGPDLEKMQSLARDLGIDQKVLFHGQVNHNQVPTMLNRLDIYVALSRLDSESFGVAILEASACEKPVVVSDADGPAEVTIEGKTGLIVPREDPKAACQAILKLVDDPQQALTMGREGRAHVLNHYTWEKSLDLMIEAYRTVAGMPSTGAIRD